MLNITTWRPGKWCPEGQVLKICIKVVLENRDYIEEKIGLGRDLYTLV
jgi:hypothetical protein